MFTVGQFIPILKEWAFLTFNSKYNFVNHSLTEYLIKTRIVA